MYNIYSNPERNKGKAKSEVENWMDTRYRLDYQPKSTSPARDGDDRVFERQPSSNLQSQGGDRAQDSKADTMKSKDKSTEQRKWSKAVPAKAGKLNFHYFS